MRNRLIKAGVKNLKEFGYPHCNEENILTDMVYSCFFLVLLEENRGHSVPMDGAVDALIDEIKEY